MSAIKETNPSAFTSKYEITASPEGFCVTGRDRRPVFVRLSQNKTALQVGFHEIDTEVSTSINLYSYPVLLKTIAKIAMSDWQRPANHPPAPWANIHEWVINNTARALHPRVHTQWQRLLLLVPETKRNVSKAVFAATFMHTIQGCETWDELYDYPNLIKDILSYRAAAVACHYALDLLSELGMQLLYHPAEQPAHLLNGRQKRVLAFYTKYFNPYHPIGSTPSEIFDAENPLCRWEVVECLAQDWMSLFSQRGKAGKSLRRTLMNVPGGIPAKDLCKISHAEMVLARPVTDRVELLTLLSFGEHCSFYGSVIPWEAGFFKKARRREILSALSLLSKHLRCKLKAKKSDIARLVGYIRDYCNYCEQEKLPYHPAHGNIVGLTERSIKWHREMRQINAQKKLEEYQRQEGIPTHIPPIPLPANPGITFLSTIGAVIREGVDMEHCIGIYAGEAVAGNQYLFHIEYKGTVASTQLNSHGIVIQSYGPLNVTNEASLYGKRVLSRWGKRLQGQIRVSAQATTNATPRSVS